MLEDSPRVLYRYTVQSDSAVLRVLIIFRADSSFAQERSALYTIPPPYFSLVCDVSR